MIDIANEYETAADLPEEAANEIFAQPACDRRCGDQVASR